MSDSLFDPHWYRVAGLRPALRSHVAVHRHHHRGRRVHLLEDRATGQQFRFLPTAWAILGRFDGRRSLDSIWQEVTAELGDEAPDQGETLALLGQLHAADLLQCDVPPDALELLERQQRKAKQRRRQRFSNPLAMRFPLLDPDRILCRALPFVAPLFGRLGAGVWIATVAIAGVLSVAHWSELTENFRERLLATQSLVLLGLAYPVVKLVHELGHAFATRRHGGEVHEAGVMLLAFMPIPYVDATASAAFPSRWQRLGVAAAGIAVELFLASLALFAWLVVEPGAMRTLCWNVMAIGGVSTLVFNANPLLRFDGYYVLSDALDIPNLGGRANRQLAYLFKRHALGLEDLESPVLSPGEAPWLVAYGIGAFAYRLFIVAVIALFVAELSLVLGALLAAWALGSQLLWPLAKHVRWLLAGADLRTRRRRAVGVAAGLASGLLVGLCVLPLPLRTRAEGVIWPPERSQVRAGADGFVRRIHATPGGLIEPGQLLIETEDPLLAAEVRLQAARLAELVARQKAEWVSDVVAAERRTGEIVAARADLARARERDDEARVRSPGRGRWVLPDTDLLGRFVHKGDVLGYVADFREPVARIVLAQGEIGLVRERTRGVEIRLAERIGERIPARIQREVPAASAELPTAALGSQGGGRFAVDPSDEGGTRALDTVFQLDLALPEGVRVAQIGGRVYARFDHGHEPLLWRAGRAMRRLLLRRLGV